MILRRHQSEPKGNPLNSSADGQASKAYTGFFYNDYRALFQNWLGLMQSYFEPIDNMRGTCVLKAKQYNTHFPTLSKRNDFDEVD